MQRRCRLTRRVAAAAGAAVGVLALLGICAATAGAEPPQKLTAQLTDTGNVLSPEAVSDVLAAVRELDVDHHLRLTVVIVDRFTDTDLSSGRAAGDVDPEKWGSQTWNISRWNLPPRAWRNFFSPPPGYGKRGWWCALVVLRCGCGASRGEAGGDERGEP